MEDESNQETALCREVGSSIDGRLLADFVKPTSGERLAELGSGCGEVLLQVATSTPGVHIDGLEIQKELVEIAKKRLKKIHVGQNVRVLVGDILAPPATMQPESYDHVFTNPPYFKVGEGRLPPDKKRALARFEQSGTLADFIACGVRLLRSRGFFYLVHRPERKQEIFTELNRAGLSPIRLLPVQNRINTPTVLLLFAAQKGGKASLVEEPPLILN
ncbi:MAG: methyltransferase domain-containing protein [Magnetococcales bacterium]|nr:methyltransferase domain-containing protein [Magnetococcales bacterium]